MGKRRKKEPARLKGGTYAVGILFANADRMPGRTLDPSKQEQPAAPIHPPNRFRLIPVSLPLTEMRQKAAPGAMQFREQISHWITTPRRLLPRLDGGGPTATFT